jgi:hypothetical protein
MVTVNAVFLMDAGRGLPLRYRNALTGKWVNARYKATRKEIASRYSEWEIIRPPEIREADPDAVLHTVEVAPHADLMRMEEPPAELQPHLAKPPAMDGSEAFLASLFLRRLGRVLRQAGTLLRTDATRRGPLTTAHAAFHRQCND